MVRISRVAVAVFFLAPACAVVPVVSAQSARELSNPSGADDQPRAPDAAEPDTAEPDTAEPDAAEPDAAEPQISPRSPGEAALRGDSSPGEFASVEPDVASQAASAVRMRMLVVDAATFGIDPIVGQVVSATIRETGGALGYQVLTQPQTVAAAQQLQMSYPPTPADLWRVSWIARVHRGVFARVWAHEGQYSVELTVASLDGTGPFFARGQAGADNLREVVAALTREALPAPNIWNTEQQAPPSAAPVTGPAAGEQAHEEPAEPEEPEPELRRWSLTVQTEAAFGVSSDFFYNHLLGVRLDFRITRDILLGAYFAYANLNARDGRADNIFLMLQFEDRIRLSSGLDLTIPLRAAVGYVPFNGPVIRLSAGLNYAISADFEIGADLVTPTFWILADGGTAVTFDVGLEATLRF